MRHYETVFFLSDPNEDYKATELHAHFGLDPLLLRINQSPDQPHYRPAITILFENEEQLITFKNSVIWAYEKYLKEKKDGKQS